MGTLSGNEPTRHSPGADLHRTSRAATMCAFYAIWRLVSRAGDWATRVSTPAARRGTPRNPSCPAEWQDVLTCNFRLTTVSITPFPPSEPGVPLLGCSWDGASSEGGRNVCQSDVSVLACLCFCVAGRRLRASSDQQPRPPPLAINAMGRHTQTREISATQGYIGPLLSSATVQREVRPRNPAAGRYPRQNRSRLAILFTPLGAVTVTADLPGRCVRHPALVSAPFPPLAGEQLAAAP